MKKVLKKFRQHIHILSEVFMMEYLRYIFLISILACSTSIGFLLSNKYINRVEELRSLSKLINVLQNKIKFTRKPLKDIFNELSKLEENKNIKRIFINMSQNLENSVVSESWRKTIEEEKENLSLKEDDINILKTLGSTLGKSDVDGQLSEINLFTELLKNQIQKAEKEKEKNSKMYKSLGTIIGLVIVIVLI